MNALIDFFNRYGIYVVAGLVLADAVLVIAVIFIKKRLSHIFRGDASNVEQVLAQMRSKQDLFDAALSQTGERVMALERALPKDLRKVGLVRYNPFSDAGGDQSFALALLNDENNGIIISSLYGREMNRVYAKRIEGGVSKHTLTEEEKEALQQAR